MWNWLIIGILQSCGDDTGMQQDEVMVVYSYFQGTKTAVIERETDLLTPDALRTH